jgi:hypothetical protein
MDHDPGSGCVVSSGFAAALFSQLPPSAASHAVIAPRLHAVCGQPPADSSAAAHDCGV